MRPSHPLAAVRRTAPPRVIELERFLPIAVSLRCSKDRAESPFRGNLD
jgi:hypothetical protein